MPASTGMTMRASFSAQICSDNVATHFQVLYPLRMTLTSDSESTDIGVDPTDVVICIEINDAPLISPAPVKKERRAERNGHMNKGSSIQFQALVSGFKKQQIGFWVSFM